MNNPNSQRFFKFYSLNCELGINSGNINMDSYIINDKIFYQDIYQKQEYEGAYLGSFALYRKLEDKSSCMVYISSYLFDNDIDDIFGNSLILEENNPEIYVLNNKTNKILCSYYFIENNEDLKITLHLLNKGNFNITLFINNIKFKDYSVSSDKEITLNNDDWKYICKNEKTICKITSLIITENLNQDSFIEITINKNEDENINSEKNIILIIIIPIIIIVLILVIIFIILKCRKRTNVIEDIKKIDLINQEAK